jgi:hypothetical protein
VLLKDEATEGVLVSEGTRLWLLLLLVCPARAGRLDELRWTVGRAFGPWN